MSALPLDLSDDDDPDLRRAPQQHDASRAGPPARRTVLIVDDDRDLRRLLRMALEELGYAAIEAADGAEGLRALRACGADRQLIVLLDYRMPRMDGGELLRLVVTDPALAARHAFALVTASGEELPAPLRALLRAHEIPVLAKPFRLEQLDTLVRQCAASRGATS